MAITIKEIARIAGVSVGTVDRALHNRGRIDPELAIKIKKIARDNHFEPSRMGKALALSRNPVKIGIIAHLADVEFMKDVIAGIESAANELESIGAQVIVEKINSLDIGKELEAIDSMVDNGVQAIAISPSDSDELREKINNTVTEKKIPLITFNTDMPSSMRNCFVGMDNKRSGRAAAGLMSALLNGKGRISIISGHETNQANRLRVIGFIDEIEKSYPEMKVVETVFCHDSDKLAEKLTDNIISKQEIVGIFMVAGGQRGVCTALERKGLSKDIKVVAYDIIPDTVKGLLNDTLDFVIDQNTFVQGYRPPHILFEHIFNGKEIGEQMQFTDILIRNKYILPEDKERKYGII